MRELKLPIHVEERAGLARESCPVRVSVPLPRGLCAEAGSVQVVTASGRVPPQQARPLLSWPDGSIKWLLVELIVPLAARERLSLYLQPKQSGAQHVAEVWPQLSVLERDGCVEIDTGAATFLFDSRVAAPLAAAAIGGRQILAAGGTRFHMQSLAGNTFTAVLEKMEVTAGGPLSASVTLEGSFTDGPTRLSWWSRAHLTAGSTLVQLEIRIRNPRPARHSGGVWDLGDRGSVLLRDFSVCLLPAASVTHLRWYAEGAETEKVELQRPWTLYQDSSGGDQWNCDNHVDRNGKPSVSFRGYRVRAGADTGEGLRATPCLTVAADDTAWLAATVQDFWQNFPKALRWEDGALCVGLFPRECVAGFELQGGEQKRHVLLCDFGVAPHQTSIPQLQLPPAVWVDPVAVEASQAVPYLIAREHAADAQLYVYVDNIVAGPHSFKSRRELIDEFGWRNFGDLYADHEAVNHRGAQPFISHYNNQYDFIYGALVHFLASGDLRWRELAEDATRHSVDIDVYHTTEDKAAFNGGLFWHTDHYLPAATCTHRTYSRRNANSGSYGGGPSNEHNYTSGLLLHYCLSGDPHSAEAVLRLADWVIDMDDGSLTLLGLFDAGQTGFASSTVNLSYQKPGRGAGNSINALLDAYALSADRRYMTKAEQLLQRCVHPADDIESLDLRHPEHRWSYLVFLQVLGKYLDTKVELGELDYHFYYARDSLLHYADWVRDHEVPYKDILDRVELPTETWSAHDIRKSHILHLAAGYAPAPARAALRERAEFFFARCLQDLLSFTTAHLTRPLVILCVYGHVPGYFRRHSQTLQAASAAHAHRFGQPTQFVPQRAAFKARFRGRLQLAGAELARLARDRLVGLKSRVLPR